MKKIKIRLKTIHQIFALACVFLLLLTILSSTNALGSILKKESEELSDEDSGLLEDAKDAINTAKSKLSDMQEKLSDIKGKINIKNLRESIPAFRSFLLSDSNKSSTFRFYTNYNGIENNTEIKFLRTVKIDVNNDAKEDISARYIIYPSFDLSSFSIAINFRLVITKLKDFPDENATFEAYMEFYFKGIIFKNISGDRIRFGYESPKDEKVPNRCVVTYELVPHRLRSRKKMEHKIAIRPGDITRESKIVMLFSYTNFENQDIVSEEKYRVVYNPATNTAIRIGGSRLKDEINFEFEKASFTKSIVDIYFSHMHNNSYTYLYCLGVPQHLIFTLKHGKDGYVEFDSFGDPIEEIGIADDIKNPSNKLYFSNFPEKAKFSWSRHLLFSKKLTFNAYSMGEGIEFGAKLSAPNLSISNLDLSIKSNGNVNFNLDLDLKEGYLEIDRSSSGLSFFMDVLGVNGSTFTASFDIIRFTESPFKIYFDKIIDGEGGLETYISGKQLEIKNLHLFVDSHKIGGFLKIDMDSCLIGPIYKEKVAIMSFNISLQIKSGNVYSCLCLNVINGINITNPFIQYNDLEITPGDISVSGNRSFCYEFLLNGSIEYNFGPNLTWGYIRLYGAAAFIIDGEFERNGKKGGAYGLISLKNYNGALNISWHTELIDGNDTRVFNVDGDSVLSLRDFHIWFEDILDINIPSFNGSLILENVSKKSGNLSLDLKGIGSKSSFEHIGFNFSSDGIIKTGKNLIINITMENITRETGRLFSAALNLSWGNYTVSDFSLDYSSERFLSIQNLSVLIKSDDNNFNFISDNFVFSGSADFEFDSSDIGNTTTFNGPILKITTTDSKLDINIKALNFGVLNLINITIDSETVGTSSISLLEKLSYEGLDEINGVDLDKINLNLSRINITLLGIYSDEGYLDINCFEIGKINGSLFSMPGFLGVVLGLLSNLSLKTENLSFKNGQSMIGLSVTLSNLTDVIQNFSFGALISSLLNGGVSLWIDNKFTNSGNHIVEMDLLYVNLSSLTLGAISQLLKQLLNVNISFGNYNNSSLEFSLENVTMKEGILGIYLQLTTGLKAKIKGSAVDNIDINVGFQGIAYLIVSLEESFDYLLIDSNNGINNESDLINGNYTTTYFLIDTGNKTIQIFDLELWIESDFINGAIEILKDKIGISLPKVKSDVGIRLMDNANFRSDNFALIQDYNKTLNQTKSNIAGYLYAQGGYIWVYFNNSWKQLAGGNVSILVEPGHARLYIDENLGIPGMKWELEEGTNFSIAGSFMGDFENITVDIWWNLENGSYLFNVSSGGSAGIDLKICDFYVSINKEIEMNGTKIKNIVLSWDEILIAGKGGFSLLANNVTTLNNITKSNATIQLDFAASIDKFDIKNLAFSGAAILPEKNETNGSSISFKNIAISGNINLSAAGDLGVKINLDNGSISGEILLDQGSYLFGGLEIESELDNKYRIYIAGDLGVEGSGSLIFEDGNFTASGSINNIGFGLEGSAPLTLVGELLNLTLSGEVDISVSGGGSVDFTISGSNISDIANLSFNFRGAGNLLIDVYLSDFQIELKDKSGGEIVVTGEELALDIGGSATISLSSKDKGNLKLTITSGVLGIFVRDFTGIYSTVNNTNLKGIYLDGDAYFNIYAGGFFQIIANLSNLSKSGFNLDRIELSGSLKLSLNDFSLAAIQDVNKNGEMVKGLTASVKNLQLNGYGDFVRVVFEVRNKTHKWTENYTKVYIDAKFAEIEQLKISSQNSSAFNFTLDGEITASSEGDGGIYFEFEDPLESVEKNQTIKLGANLNQGSITIKGRNEDIPFSVKSDQINLSFDEIILYGSCNLEILLNGPNITSGNLEDIFKAIEFINTQPTFGGITISSFKLNLELPIEQIGLNLALNNLELIWTGKFNLNITLQKTVGNKNSTIFDNIYIDLNTGGSNQLFNLSIDVEVSFESEIADGYAHVKIDSFESKGRYSYFHAGNSDNPNATNPYIKMGGDRERSIKSVEAEFDIDAMIQNMSIYVNAVIKISNITSERELYAGVLFDESLFDELPANMSNVTQWIMHLIDHFENMTVRWDRSFSYDNISLNIHSFSVGNFTFTDIPVYFPGRESEGAGEIILSFSGNPLNPSDTNFTLKGCFSKPVNLRIVDRWTHPLGLFNIKIGTLEISEGEFELTFMNNASDPNEAESSQDFYLSINSTCDLELDLIKVEFAFFGIDLQILGFELHGGGLTLKIHKKNWSDGKQGFIEFTSYELNQDHPSIEVFVLKIFNIEIIRGIYWDIDCPYLYIGWKIESIPEFPWSRGYLNIDSKGQPVSFTTNSERLIIVGILNIFGRIVANGFNISWRNFEKDKGFSIIDTEGSLQSHCTIEILVDDVWRHLWPIGGSQNNPPNIPTKPSGPTSGLSGQSLTYYTSSSDPDGDQIEYGWDWNNDGAFEWEISENSRSHIYYNNGVKTYSIRVKAIDEYGLESDWSEKLYVTINSTSGGVTGSWDSPILGHNDPGSEWEDEAKAYDLYLSTYAKSVHKISKWDWTEPLEIILHDGGVETCPEVGKIRFKSWYNPSWCDKVSMYVYRYNEYKNEWEWAYLYRGKYYDHQDDWNEIHYQHSSYRNINKISISFHLKGSWNGGQGISSDLYDIDYWKID